MFFPLNRRPKEIIRRFSDRTVCRVGIIERSEARTRALRTGRVQSLRLDSLHDFQLSMEGTSNQKHTAIEIPNFLNKLKDPGVRAKYAH